MRLATGALEGKYDATSHLTIEGALALLAPPKEPKSHPIRSQTGDERWVAFARFPVERRAWAIYLNADQMPLADIAAFIGESEAMARALITPVADPGWHWDIQADNNDPNERRFHDLVRRSIWPLIEYQIQGIRCHALIHAEGIRLCEYRYDLEPIIATMMRECGTRCEQAKQAFRASLAELPRQFVRALYRATGLIALAACTGKPRSADCMWLRVGQYGLPADRFDADWGTAWVDHYGYGAANPSLAFIKIAEDVFRAAEVWLAYAAKED
jgi:hypothetical protein